MPYCDVGTERLYYEIHGEGPKLVLIRGLSRSLRFWEPLLPHLEGRFQLMLFDHRGIGRSEIRDARFNVRDMAADLAGLLRETGFGPAHVFGLSLGGMVAQRLAIDHPDVVDQLMLCSTTPGSLRARFPRVDTLLKLAFYTRAFPVDASVRRQGPLLMSPAFHQHNPHVAESWAPFLSLEPLDPKVVFRQALGAALHDAWAELPSVRAPTMVLHGDADRLISFRNGEHLAARVPSAELVRLDGMGHDVVAEGPAEVARHIRRFLLNDAARSAA